MTLSMEDSRDSRSSQDSLYSDTINRGTSLQQEQVFSDARDHDLDPCPFDGANVFSKLIYFWMEKMMWTGFRRPLELKDLPNIRKQDDAGHLSRKFTEKFEKRRSLIWSLHDTFGWKFYACAIPKFVFDTCELTQPLLLKWFIEYAQNPEDHSWYTGWLILGLMIVLQTFSFLIINQYFFVVVMIGKHVISSLRAVLYAKVLRLSNESRSKSTTGDIVNRMSTDANKIGTQSTFLHLIWSGLYQMFVSLVLLFTLLGWSALISIVIICILVPFIAGLAKYIQKKNREMLKYTDRRIGIINEILNSIRVIKYYVWEGKFLDKVKQQRSLELGKIVHILLVKLFSNSLTSLSPLLLSMTSFIVFALLGNELNSSIIFPALSYYLNLRFPISLFPSVLSNLFEAKVSANRIEEFLLLEELDEVNRDAPKEFPIVVNHADFVWKAGDNGDGDEVVSPDHNVVDEGKGTDKYAKLDEEQEDVSVPMEGESEEDSKEAESKSSFYLSDINVKIPANQLTIVVGSVGSGKTSFLEAMIGEMKCVRGSFSTRGKIAYCPQKAFIQNATVRENITFGEEFDQNKYDTVVRACALKSDIAIFPGGSDCEMGSRGINTSGGQKARISLARACYSNAETYLLDDVIAAVDSHVQKHLFKECILNPKMLGNKTRVLVTHHLSTCRHADNIILLDNGNVVDHGPFDALMEKKGRFYEMVQEHVLTGSDSESDSDNDEEDPPNSAPSNEMDKSQKKPASGQLIEKEEQRVGTVKAQVYLRYFKAAGYHYFFAMLFFVAAAQLFQMLSSWWLSVWSDGDPNSIFFYMGIYAALSISSGIGSVIRDALYIFLCLAASKALHRKSLYKVIRAPVKFFDINPIGRILNRFSKDIAQADTELAIQIRWFFNCLAQIVATIALIVIVNPFFIIPLIPIGITYYVVQLFYRRTSRELQRMLSTTRSPMFALFSESIDGVATLRSFQQEKRFTNEFHKRLNTNMRPLLYQMASQRWLGVRMELIGRSIIWSSVLFCILFRKSLNPGVIALSLTYVLRITGNLNWFIRTSVNVENLMNSIERLLHYSDDIEQEAPLHLEYKPPKEWPEYGSIKFSNVYFKYRSELPHTLKNLSAHVFGSESVGIVGKTGAGKSTFVSSLFRTTELSEGKIEIDDIDISKMGVADIRNVICILPQDAMLFQGTVRENLDPFDEYTDAQIWRSLERSHMKDRIGSLSDPVTEFGGNFSAGEGQLLCMSRAFLRTNSKIICMDEASALIDENTDKLLNETLQKEFQDKTVLIIAHRLASVIWCDRIMVLSEGELKEFDSPYNLLKQPNSMFSALVRETGSENEKLLREKVFGSE